MKPAEHPDFFRMAAPEGQSRESTIELTADGRFLHDGIEVNHPLLRDAMHTWITRHPDTGRFILSNGYDWVYVMVHDTPFFVTSIAHREGDVFVRLSDGSEEPLEPTTATMNNRGEVCLRVKPHAPHGPFTAKMSRFAQSQLAPYLETVSDAANAAAIALVTPRGRAVLSEDA